MPFVAFLGCDGSGKSSVISAVSERLIVDGHQVTVGHWQPKPLTRQASATSSPAVTCPHGGAPRGTITSIVKLVWMGLNWWIAWAAYLSKTSSTGFVLYDRFHGDITIDPLRYRYGGPLWLARVASRLMPQPDIIIYLDADPEVLLSRKQEVEYGLLLKLRAGYLHYCAAKKKRRIVDANDSICKVVLAVINTLKRSDSTSLRDLCKTPNQISMSSLKRKAKAIIPPVLWTFARSFYLRRRQARAPKVGQFGSAVETAKALGVINSEWKRRIRDVISCPDNQKIPRCQEAGCLADGVIAMHNGVKVGGLSYYGAGVMNMLIQNKGVHEPQEELAFQEVLPWISEGSAMLELGAYWGFYSLWFGKAIKGARNYLVEPSPDNLEAGKFNFTLNQRVGEFVQAYVGNNDSVATDGIRIVSVDSFLKNRGIDRLAMLHSDVQGAEVEMLKGASGSLAARRIDYVFISTHGNEIHEECLHQLREHDYKIMVSATLDQSYADDGLIVAMSPSIDGPKELVVSLKPDDKS